VNLPMAFPLVTQLAASSGA